MAKTEAARRELLKDIESYTCGEIPSAIAMRAPPGSRSGRRKSPAEARN
jgi:hypothetical protein